MLHSFNFTMDYNDIQSIEMIKIINEESIYLENEDLREAYMFEFLLQFNMLTLNGLTLKVN
jgi:hypothetical protein